jgi:hypothetical protein
MKRFLCLSVAAWFVGLVPAAFAQPPVAPVRLAQPSLDAAVRARVSGRADGFSTTIQGNALTSTDGHLADTLVRLRDARVGHVLATQLTDQTGLFAFRGLEPGSYIVELVTPDQTAVLAASQILNVNAGEVVSAVVKLPFRTPPFAGILGDHASVMLPGSARAVVAEAALNSVLIVAAPLVAVSACPQQVF